MFPENPRDGYRPYRLDRQQTDFRHKLPCVQEIYTKAGLRLLSKEEADSLFVGFDAVQLDRDFGIDYVCQKENGDYVFIQERLKPKRFSSYMDFNLRYERLTSKVRTEFVKIYDFFTKFSAGYFHFRNGHQQVRISFFLVYCFIDDDNAQIVKRVTVNLFALYRYIKEGRIRTARHGDPKFNAESGYWNDDEHVFYAPIINDHDGSSSFIAFNVAQMLTHFTDQKWIKAEGDWRISKNN